MPLPPSDDDVYLYRQHSDGTDGPKYSCPTASALALYNWLQTNTPPNTAAAFVTALGDVLAS